MGAKNLAFDSDSLTSIATWVSNEVAIGTPQAESLCLSLRFQVESRSSSSASSVISIRSYGRTIPEEMDTIRNCAISVIISRCGQKKKGTKK